jgi:hypothetical protein
MSRKGEITLRRIRHEWPYHVALAADKVAGSNHRVVNDFARGLSVAPRTYSFRRNDVDYVVFCFPEPVDAEVFCQRFGGDRLEPK